MNNTADIPPVAERDIKPENAPQLALVRSSPFSQIRELAQYLDDLDKIAGVLCKATILPPDMQAPANLKLVLLQGLAMGFDPIQAIRASYIITSKDQPPRVGYYVEALVALVRSSAVCRFFRVEVATADKCRVVCARKDEDESVVHVFEMTLEQARAANLDKKWERDHSGQLVSAQKYTWKTAPADMLRNRTCGRAVKTVFQDVVFGMATPDELDDINAAEQLETAAAREFAPVPIRAVRTTEPSVVPADTRNDPARADIVDAELVQTSAQEAQEGSGDAGWDAMLADVGRLAKVDTAGWLPEDVLELWGTKLTAATSKGLLNLLAPMMSAIGSHVSKSKTVGEVFVKVRGMYNDRDRELKQAARQAGAQ